MSFSAQSRAPKSAANFLWCSELRGFGVCIWPTCRQVFYADKGPDILRAAEAQRVNVHDGPDVVRQCRTQLSHACSIGDPALPGPAG